MNFAVPVVHRAALVASCATLGFFGMLFTGCSSSYRLYEGPQRPLAEVVILDSEKATLNHYPGIRLHSIDGVPGPRPKAFGYSSPGDGTFHIELLPGPHTLSVGFYKLEAGFNINSTTDIVLPFDGQTGHRYILGAISSFNRWSPYIVDAVTGEPLYPQTMRDEWMAKNKAKEKPVPGPAQ
jgi:hypothetical protein